MAFRKIGMISTIPGMCFHRIGFKAISDNLRNYESSYFILLHTKKNKISGDGHYLPLSIVTTSRK